MIGIVGPTLGTLSADVGGGAAYPPGVRSGTTGRLAGDGPGSRVVGRDGVVEGERVVGVVTDAVPEPTDRLELGVAPLRIEGALPRPAEDPVNSDAGSAAGLSPRVAERKPRGSSRSPPIASGSKVRSARGTMAADRDAGAAAPPPEVSRSSAGNGSLPTIAPGSAIAPSS